ncbi:Helix-turn-helix domain-containing protein [Flavobacterium longum]|uniref:helix-turn-helix domain-containing protein n=1 Tax=Flavobacterium longum TaxID=1299340 RepID=UPI0039E9CB12
MTFNLYNSLMLAGITQGIVFALVVLLSKKYRVASTIFLAAFILSFSLDNLQYYLEDVGLITERQLNEIYFLPFAFLSGGLLLLFGLSFLNAEWRWQKKHLWTFAPFGVALAYSTTFKILALSGIDVYRLSLFAHMERDIEVASIACDLAILIFLFRRVRRTEKNSQTPDVIRTAWLKKVILTLSVLWVIWLYITFLDYVYDTEYWYGVYLGMTAVIYWTGHVGIYRFGEPEKKRPRPEAKKPTLKNEHIVALQKLLVDDRLFLKPTLTLDELAESLHLSKTHLSRTINAELGMGFPDYLNMLRVEEAKSYLTNPDYAHYTLVAIGLEAGFNSKTTFNTAFKKVTSLTPSEYRATAGK